MRSFPPYAELLSSVPLVLGTVDDHDHGLNDAGRELPDLAGRRDAYLEFLGEPSSEQPGVYSSRVLGSGADAARVIFLDTRHNRDLHWLPSVGGVKLPLFPVVAAFGRFLTSELGLGSGYAGRVLGEELWGWLEGELGREPEGVTVVVSSIQVLTTNPLVESWGHFPKEKVSQVRAERKHVRRAGDRAGRRGSEGGEGGLPPPARDLRPLQPQKGAAPHASSKEMCYYFGSGQAKRLSGGDPPTPNP
jgi:alkaline phosphatase D